MFPLDTRAFLILYHVVTIYLKTRVPVGSQTLSHHIPFSPATIRNRMAELEEHGFLISPHRSAGRFPTPKALRLYAQHVLDQNILSEDDYFALTEKINQKDPCSSVSQTLADLCECAGVFFSAPQDPIVSSLTFISVSPGKAMSILSTYCGRKEHHIIPIPEDITPCQLQEASNYLSTSIKGLSLAQAMGHIENSLESQARHLYHLLLHLVCKHVIQKESALEIKGHAHLLSNVQDMGELDMFKTLFSWLETQKIFSEILMQVIETRSVQIFFGLEEEVFNINGCSLIVAPYEKNHYRGAVGVVGPLHMDYRRIIPIIDTMAKLLERMHV